MFYRFASLVSLQIRDMTQMVALMNLRNLSQVSLMFKKDLRAHLYDLVLQVS